MGWLRSLMVYNKELKINHTIVHCNLSLYESLVVYNLELERSRCLPAGSRPHVIFYEGSKSITVL